MRLIDHNKELFRDRRRLDFDVASQIAAQTAKAYQGCPSVVRLGFQRAQMPATLVKRESCRMIGKSLIDEIPRKESPMNAPESEAIGPIHVVHFAIDLFVAAHDLRAYADCPETLNLLKRIADGEETLQTGRADREAKLQGRGSSPEEARSITGVDEDVFGTVSHRVQLHRRIAQAVIESLGGREQFETILRLTNSKPCPHCENRR